MQLLPEHRRWPRVFAAPALAGAAMLLAGCGGSSSNGSVAHLGASTVSSTATATGGAGAASGPPEVALLAFAKCMRANGLPNFPDPSGGGFHFSHGAGIDPLSAAFKSAQAKCKQFQPDGGPGSGPPPSAQTLARFLKVAQCMRQHGISNFPDPRTSMPQNLHPPAGAGRFVISDIEGVILVMGSIDTQSPQFMRAATACAFPLHNH